VIVGLDFPWIQHKGANAMDTVTISSNPEWHHRNKPGTFTRIGFRIGATRKLNFRQQSPAKAAGLREFTVKNLI